MPVEIDPLLERISALAPRFGRAQSDLEALVSRGRAGDYKGVMQNARLVLEVLLRALVIDELKQTPGKAMLDELVTKFRQQANAGIVPTNVLAHMGTVQAWGNLSAHDHAGSLADSGVQVGAEEVVASLNSMVAILTWYAQKKGLSPSATSLPAVAPKPGTPGKRRTPLLAGGALVAVIVGGFTALGLFKKPQPPDGAPPGFERLDAMYDAWKLPVPPPACRRVDDAAALAKSAGNPDSLTLIDNPSPEAAFLLARARHETSRDRSPALDLALGCEGFAAAYWLEARIALEKNDPARALTWLQKARDAAPTFLEPRVTLAGLQVTSNPAAAEKETTAILAANPDFGPAFLVRAHARASRGDEAAAMVDLCQAAKLGSTQAKDEVERNQLQCPGSAAP